MKTSLPEASSLDAASPYIPAFTALNCVLFIFKSAAKRGFGVVSLSLLKSVSARRQQSQSLPIRPNTSGLERMQTPALTDMSLLHTAQRKNHVFVCPVALIKYFKPLLLNDRTLGYLAKWCMLHMNTDYPADWVQPSGSGKKSCVMEQEHDQNLNYHLSIVSLHKSKQSFIHLQ